MSIASKAQLKKTFSWQNMRRLAGLFLFDAVWFAAVIGRGDWLLVTALLVVAQIGLAWKGGALIGKRSFYLYVLLLVLGLGLEGTVILSGIISFTEGPFPWWLVLLWFGFVAMLMNTLDWLAGRYWVAGFFGIASGPLTYAIGIRLDAATLNGPEWQLWALYGVLWCIYMLIFAYVMKLQGESHEETKTA